MNEPTYTIDPTTLKESVDDFHETQTWCDNNPMNPKVVDYLRMLGRLETAEIYAFYFVHHADTDEDLTRAKLRLATVYRCREHFNKAMELYSSVLEAAHRIDNPMLLADAFEAQAMMWIDMNCMDPAYACAQRAYELISEEHTERLKSIKRLLNVLETTDIDLDDIIMFFDEDTI